MTDKAALRSTARQQRSDFVAGLDALAHRLAFKAAPSPLLEMIGAREVIALYVPVGDEAPATRLAPALRVLGKKLCLPRVRDRLGTMDFRRWSEEDDLVPGPFGTSHPEPGAQADPEVIIAPLLGFDRDMNRLGQGGGYYDRAFARHPDALRIGLSWSAQQFDALPSDPWDMPLHAVLTERAFIIGEFT